MSELESLPWPGWPLPDKRQKAKAQAASSPGRSPDLKTKHWPRGKVHPPRRIERPDLLRGHLATEHGYAEDGLFPMPESLTECFALHAELHHQNPGGRLMGPSR